MRKPAYTFLRRGRKTCQMDILAHGNRPSAAIPDLKFIPRPISIFRPPQNLALWLFVSSDPRHLHGAPPPGRAPFSCTYARPGVLVSYAPGSRSPSRGHIRYAHSSVRSGMCSPLRASLYLSAATVSPGGQAHPGGQQRQVFVSGLFTSLCAPAFGSIAAQGRKTSKRTIQHVPRSF